MTDDQGYVDYFAVLGLDTTAKPGEVRKVYQRKMKDLVAEIRQVEITEDRRARYLLEMAKLNAALCLLRDAGEREAYWQERDELIALERRWRESAGDDAAQTDALRREFDRKLRHFLSKYLEELMLTAGRDKECIEASHWDAAHERHASRILRHYRQEQYQRILERLPYYNITPVRIDWAKRRTVVESVLAGKGP